MMISNKLLADTSIPYPYECSMNVVGCSCYNPIQLKKMADSIVELKKCQLTLIEKNNLLQERFIKFESAGEAWWQEPEMIIGGIVVSASLASLITIWTIK